MAMVALAEDTDRIRHGVAHVIELYHELAAENGAPSLGRRTGR